MFQINPGRVSQWEWLACWMGQFFIVLFGVPDLGSQKASGIFQSLWYPEHHRGTLGTTVSLHITVGRLFATFHSPKHFCLMQNDRFQLCSVVPCVSGPCANKLKKETKPSRHVKKNSVLHCWRDFEHICSGTKSVLFLSLYREAN